MTDAELNAVETCDYISEVASELRRLADAAGADRLSTLLAQVVEKAGDLARKHQSSAGSGAAHRLAE